MDQSTKQRLVGAVVLVVAVLWLVPVFLDGPANETDTISESVNLPGLETTPTEQRRIDLREPLPSAGTASPSESAESAVSEPIELPAEPPAVAADDESVTTPESTDQSAAEVARPAPTDAATEANDAVAASPKPPVSEPQPQAAATKPQAEATKPQAAPASVPADGLWAVQLGSFSDRDNASRLAASLRADGISAFLTEIERNGTTLHRVRVGPVADRSAAERLVAELDRKGHSARVVQHP
ncbi:MAG: SPOR domain-containing protein [Pseudomonadota bacterium]